MKEWRKVISSTTFSSTTTSLLQPFMPGQLEDPTEPSWAKTLALLSDCWGRSGNSAEVKLKKAQILYVVSFILFFFLNRRLMVKGNHLPWAAELLPKRDEPLLTSSALSAPSSKVGCRASMGSIGAGEGFPFRALPAHSSDLSLAMRSAKPSFCFHGSLPSRARDEHVMAIDPVMSITWSFWYAAVWQKMCCKELTAKNTWKLSLRPDHYLLQSTMFHAGRLLAYPLDGCVKINP